MELMPQEPFLTDGELVEKARQGDYDAFASLVDRYERRIFALALRILRKSHDAEEVVQQTFLTMLEHLQDFRGDSAFSTWLLRIATNHALGLLRREAVRATLPLAGASHEPEDGETLPHLQYIAEWRESPEDILARKETRDLIEQALQDLDDKYRLVFVLRDIEGLSTTETAELLGLTEANVKVRLLRARLMLREKLTRLFGDPNRVFPPHTHDH
ncbi:MAG: sigma-70 family RNA polymerase sigma factor [Thermogutta sp.]